VCSNDIAVPVYHNECRPRIHGVRAPDAELPIVDDRMCDVIAQTSFPDAGSIALGDIFATVHTDDRYIARILLLDLPQLRKNMNAVDSAIRPEVEQDHVSAQLGQTKRIPTSVKPVEALWEFRRANPRDIRDWL
jgi:hypothetical protein